jgi:hypothetical protein
MSALLDSLLDKERRGECAWHDGLGGHDSPAGQRQLREHMGRLSDAADAQEARDRAAEEADFRTRAAREAIKGLARSMTEQEACALISCLSDAIQASGWGHVAAGVAAVESLMDAHHALENCGE